MDGNHSPLKINNKLPQEKTMPKENKSSPDIRQVINAGKTSGGKKHLKRLIFIVILAVIAFASFKVWRKTEPPKMMQFSSKEADHGSLTVLVTATGTLEPTNEVEVGSEVSGILESVDVDFNSTVTVGQLLAKLDTTKLNAQVTQSKAAVQSAEAKVLQAEATLNETHSKLLQYQKVRELSNNKVPSQSEMDAAEAAFARAKADKASAQAAVAQAQATLEGYETDLSKAVIRSPINGIVLTRNVEQGQTVAASFETPVLFTLAENLTQMELHVNVDEADIGRVNEGQNATFTVDAYPNRTFKAQIIQTRYGAETVDGVVTYETVLSVDNSDLALRPGMTATADIIVLQVDDALIVPNAALRFEMPEDTSKQNQGGLLSKILPHPRADKLNRKKKPSAVTSKPSGY